MVGNHTHNAAFQSAVASGDEARRNGQLKQAIEIYLQAVNGVETPPASICLRIARCYERLEDRHSACRWALAVVNAGDEFQSWQAAFALLQRCGLDGGIGARRSVRLAVTGSFTTTQLAQALTLAARQVGIAVETYESPYGQYEQEIINPRSPLYEFRPDVVLLACRRHGPLRLLRLRAQPVKDEIATLLRVLSVPALAPAHTAPAPHAHRCACRARRRVDR